jgi:hypothetical protein
MYSIAALLRLRSATRPNPILLIIIIREHGQIKIIVNGLSIAEDIVYSTVKE